MSDSKAKDPKWSEDFCPLVLKARNLSMQIQQMKKARLLREKVVDLETYRSLKAESDRPGVLVLDDDTKLCEELGRALQSKGFRVLVANNAKELSDIIRGESIDLFIVECGLSWINAFDLCRLLKGEPLSRDLPVVLMTDDHSNLPSREGFEAGGDEVLTKPLDMLRTVSIIQFLLDS